MLDMRTLGCLLLALCLAPPIASAQSSPPPNEEAVCAPEQPALSDTEYLRAVSLDLRGRVPDLAEYDAATDPAMIEAMIAEWTASEPFVERMVRRHRALLWNNVSNFVLLNAQVTLSTSPEGVLFRNGTRATAFRGDNVACLNEPARFAPDGRPVTRSSTSPRGVPVEREGYVLVRPYWAPSTEVRVCAFDAQEAERSARGIACGSPAGLGDTGCGCGPGLRWCATGAVGRIISAQLGLEVEQRIAAVMRDGGRYEELFTSRRAFVNGPILHLYRHLSRIPGPIVFRPLPVPEEDLPERAFDDLGWAEIELPEQHAGILTSPAYLLRFQTQRARASRFYDAFVCEPFQPPAGGIPASGDEEARIVDLQRRPGCLYCHAQLEPASASWGRWTSAGVGWLGPDAFPAMREDCRDCALGRIACAPECSQRYVTRALSPEQRPYLGMLHALEFMRPEHVSYPDDGPARLVRSTIADGRLPQCVTRRTAEWLLGRPLGEPERPWLDAVARDFVASGMRMPGLVQAIVTHPTYRRAR
jgi:hypothetical protein